MVLGGGGTAEEHESIGLNAETMNTALAVLNVTVHLETAGLLLLFDPLDLPLPHHSCCCCCCCYSATTAAVTPVRGVTRVACASAGPSCRP